MASVTKNMRSEDPTRFTKDKIQLLQIFPEEIWIKIITTIPDDNDKQNLCNASIYFGNLLGDQKIIFLFPKIFPILGKYFDPVVDNVEEFKSFKYDEGYDNTEDEDDHSDAWSRDSVNLYPDYPEESIEDQYRSIKKIELTSTLKLVCREWCSGVESYYANLPCHFSMITDKNLEEQNIMAWPLALTQTEFKESRQNRMTKFIVNFQRTHHHKAVAQRCPFLSKSVAIIFTGIPNKFYKEVIRALKKYGSHILFLKIVTTNRFDFSTKLRQLVQFTPNVKVLKVECRWDRDIISGNHFAAATFPKLEKLQFLQTKNMPEVIFNEIIRQNYHVSILEVERMVVPFGYDICSFPMQNLRNLAIKFYSEVDFNKLSNPQVNWPLEKLYIDFHGYLEWARVFQVLESKWGETLTNLEINLPFTSIRDEQIKIMKQAGSLRLNLPKLQSLKLLIGNVSSIDFILPLQTTLETLDLSMGFLLGNLSNKMKREAEKMRKGQEIKFLESFTRGSNELLRRNSNIWELFIKMRQLDVSVLNDISRRGKMDWIQYRATATEKMLNNVNV